MTSPTTGLSKLSLEGMPPTTRSQSQQHQPPQSSELGDDEYDEGPVRSPATRLRYGVDRLDDETEELVRELFRQPSQEETPQIVLEWCGVSNDPDIYAFQLHEVVPRTIRIGSPTSRIPVPRCNCMGEGDGTRPCRHLIWLMDQITKQTVHDHDPDEVLDLDERGFPEKLGSPFDRIARFHVDVLADGLHCDFDPSREYAEPNPHRVREVREILAAVAGEGDDDAAVDSYAPDLFDNPPLVRTPDILARGELEYTLLRLLLSNNEFFAMFLKLLSPADKVLDPFRKIQQRVARVLHDLSAYSAAGASADPSAVAGDGYREGPCDVAWAAGHLVRAVEQIQVLVGRSEPLEPWERASAARALVWILKAVVMGHSRDAHAGPTQDDRNLYQRLIGNARDGVAFVVDTLYLLPDQNQYIDELEHIRERVEVSGYQESFMRKLEGLISKLRRRASTPGRAGPAGEGGGAGSKRQGPAGPGAGAERRAAKRAR